jgi:hypothetical protein
VVPFPCRRTQGGRTDAATEHLTTPARARTPRSAWAAALANRTGPGLGYADLRRPLRVVAAAVGTLVLVVVAFATDASNAPWLWRAVAAECDDTARPPLATAGVVQDPPEA